MFANVAFVFATVRGRAARPLQARKRPEVLQKCHFEIVADQF